MSATQRTLIIVLSHLLLLGAYVGSYLLQRDVIGPSALDYLLMEPEELDYHYQIGSVIDVRNGTLYHIGHQREAEPSDRDFWLAFCYRPCIWIEALIRGRPE